MDTRADLPVNTVIDGTYCIKRKIGGGGFGITYEADDLGLGTTVALKEYYPADFGDRSGTMSVIPKSERYESVFEWGRSSFLDEAQMLARFRHPSIVRVTRVFQANDTAYMVMDYENGKDLETWLKDLGRRPTQTELDAICAPLLHALALMHAQHFLHRDIAPDNIIIRADGSPVLLDFGAARRAMAERTKTLTRIVKAGYSPHEQYAADGRLQGPWTDIYALGATLYRAIMGAPPEVATLRIDEDRLAPAAGPYRRKFLAAVNASLRMSFKQRPQDVAALRALMFDRPETTNSPRFTGPTKAMLAVACLVLLLAGGYGIYVYSQGVERTSLAAVGADASGARSDASKPAQPDPKQTMQPDTIEPARPGTGEPPAAGAEHASIPQPPQRGTSQPQPEASEGETRTAATAPRTPEIPPPPQATAPTNPPAAASQPAARPATAVASGAAFDGTWTFIRSITERCGQNGSVFSVVISNGVVHGPGGKGSVSGAGNIHFPGKANVFTGKLSNDRGSGSYTGRCTGTFTARRKSASG